MYLTQLFIVPCCLLFFSFFYHICAIVKSDQQWNGGCGAPWLDVRRKMKKQPPRKKFEIFLVNSATIHTTLAHVHHIIWQHWFEYNRNTIELTGTKSFRRRSTRQEMQRRAGQDHIPWHDKFVPEWTQENLPCRDANCRRPTAYRQWVLQVQVTESQLWDFDFGFEFVVIILDQSCLTDTSTRYYILDIHRNLRRIRILQQSSTTTCRSKFTSQKRVLPQSQSVFSFAGFALSVSSSWRDDVLTLFPRVQQQLASGCCIAPCTIDQCVSAMLCMHQQGQLHVHVATRHSRSYSRAGHEDLGTPHKKQNDY